MFMLKIFESLGTLKGGRRGGGKGEEEERQ